MESGFWHKVLLLKGSNRVIASQVSRKAERGVLRLGKHDFQPWGEVLENCIVNVTHKLFTRGFVFFRRHKRERIAAKISTQEFKDV